VIDENGVEYSRRAFLRIGGGVGLAVGGILLFGVSLPVNAAPALRKGNLLVDASDPSDTRSDFVPNAFVRITRDGRIRLVMPKVEMGQGVYTSIPMLLAEELEVSLDNVELETSHPNSALYTDPLLSAQITGGSDSIRYAWEPLRRAGAAARVLLIQAAASQWKVPLESCRAENARVIHGATGRTLEYRELVETVMKLPIPQGLAKTVTLKDPRQFRLIGKPLKRLDSSEKVNGSAVFGIDVRIPGMLYAVSITSPVAGGKVKAVDDRFARKIPGVRQVVTLERTVAVVGDHTWAAKRGLAAMVIEWDDGPNAELNTRTLEQDLRAVVLRGGVVSRKVGDVEEAFDKHSTHYEAEYSQPFLAHAPMEPLNCTVHVRPDGCDIWTGTQVPVWAVDASVKYTGLPRERIGLHNRLLGGGFGRRSEVDIVIQALQIGKHVNAPVKLTWTREEDIRQCTLRPMYHDRIAASLDEHGWPVGWRHTVVGSSVLARFAPEHFKGGLDPDAVAVASDLPYAIPNQRIEYVRQEPRGIVTGFWRGVGPVRGTFVVESFIDELAARAKIDPVTYRRALLSPSPRALHVLNVVARESGWDKPLDAGAGRGVAVMHAFGSFLSAVVEADVRNDEVHVRRVVIAVDCGQIVNPDTVDAQIRGGAIFAITAALYGGITIDRGRVVQGNFNDYRILRIHETPRIEVHTVHSNESPGGIGEAGCAILAPALVNAIFAATGKRLRYLSVGNQLADGNFA
jgi:CO/xanthine dehydrogenase Mo-binding subunit